MKRIFALIMTMAMLFSAASPAYATTASEAVVPEKAQDIAIQTDLENGSAVLPEFDLVVEPDQLSWTSSRNICITNLAASGSVILEAISSQEYTQVADLLMALSTGDVLAIQEHTHTVTTSGVYYVYVMDEFGGMTVKSTEIYMVDSVNPVIQLQRQSTQWEAIAEYIITVTDADSGVETVTLTMAEAEETITLDENGQYQFTLSRNEIFTIKAQDKAGNTASLQTEETMIDLEFPVFQGVQRVKNIWLREAEYSISVTDNESGVVSVVAQAENGQPQSLEKDEAGNWIFIATENTTYALTATDGVGNSATIMVTESKLDLTPPEIYDVVRSQTLGTWTQKADYTFCATDAQSGVRSLTVTKQGVTVIPVLTDYKDEYAFSLDENGEYTITVTDRAGNTQTYIFQETHTDTTAPNIEATVQDIWSRKSNTILLQVTDDGELSTVRVTAAQGSSYRLKRLEDGKYRLVVYANDTYTITAKDKAQNEKTINITTDHIDTTAPSAPELNKAPANEWANTDVLLSARAEDSQSGVTAYWYTTTESTFSKDTWQLMPLENGVGKLLLQQPQVSHYYVVAEDLVGNISQVSTIHVSIDKTAPEVFDITRLQESWSQQADYTFRVSDDASGIKTVTLTSESGTASTLEATEDGTYSFAAFNNGVYLLTATDNAGNQTSVRVAESLIDLIPPVIHDISVQDQWDAYENTVSIKTTDESELVSVVVYKDGLEISRPEGTNDIFTVILTENGEYSVTATDRAGNSTTSSFLVQYIDSDSPTQPELTLSYTSWINQNVTLTAIATDAQSGVTAYWYTTEVGSFNKDTWKLMSTEGGIGSVLLTAEQDTDYYVVAEDGVGRVSAPAQVHVQIDKTAPGSLELTYGQGEGSGYISTHDSVLIYLDHMEVSLSAQDPASGVVAYEYQIVPEGSSLNDSAWIRLDDDASGVTVILAGDEITGSVYFRALDQAGNYSEPVTAHTADGSRQVFILENTHTNFPAPGVEAVTSEGVYNGQWAKEDITITVSGSGAVSGIAGYEYCCDNADPDIADIAWTAVPLEELAYILRLAENCNATYRFRAVSYAGRRSQETTLEIKLQKSVPLEAALIPDAPTGTNGWYTRHPDYKIVLPERDAYAAPVRYEMQATHDGQQAEPIIYNYDNAPQIANDGIWSVSIIAIDEAGNTSETVIMNLRVDSNAPGSVDVFLDSDSILATGAAKPPVWSETMILDKRIYGMDKVDIFKKDSVTITASANGSYSGIEGIYYQLFSQEENNDGQWKPLPAAGLRLDPDQKCFLHLKAVDKAGNITYFSSQGFILDAQAPGGQANGDCKITLSGELSNYGIYSGDVTAQILVEEPLRNTVHFSGIREVSYQIVCDDTVTERGQLYPGSGTTQTTDGRIGQWAGSLNIPAQKNNGIVRLEIFATDNSGNTHRTVCSDIKIDTTLPTITAFYDNNAPAGTLGKDTIFTGSRTLTITVSDRNFVAEMAVITLVDQDTGRKEKYNWTGEGTVHQAVIPVQTDGHYKLTISVTDGAGNASSAISFQEGTIAPDLFVLDNTAPKITVSYDNNKAANELYFNAPRTATVRVTERNFDPQRITATITAELESGTHKPYELSKWTSEGNTHTATITFRDSGSYAVAVAGTDAAGNKAGKTSFTGQAPQKFVVDTILLAPVITGVDDGSAYHKDAVPHIRFEDLNMEGLTLTLYRTRLNEIRQDVTQEYLGEHKWQEIVNGLESKLDIFPVAQEHDGIYTLVATGSDKAGNVAATEVTFCLARFGSVYAYGDYLTQINNRHILHVTEDLIITEITPADLIPGTMQVQITKDGVLLADPLFTVVPSESQPGSSGWYEYIYTISKDNFLEDGEYSIVISSQDMSGNYPENTAQEYAISFAVDTTKPVITGIYGMEEEIVNGTKQNVSVSVMDNISIDNAQVFCNGEEIARWDAEGVYNDQFSFTIPEGLNQEIRLVITDMAGNVLDTDSEDFAPGFPYHKSITVSPKWYVRYYANTPLFVGSIGGGLSLSGLLVLLLRKRKKH